MPEHLPVPTYVFAEKLRFARIRPVSRPVNLRPLASQFETISVSSTSLREPRLRARTVFQILTSTRRGNTFSALHLCGRLSYETQTSLRTCLFGLRVLDGRRGLRADAAGRDGDAARRRAARAQTASLPFEVLRVLGMLDAPRQLRLLSRLARPHQPTLDHWRNIFKPVEFKFEGSLYFHIIGLSLFILPALSLACGQSARRSVGRSR